jgi:hypothetical protein
MRIAIRMIGIATTFFWIFLIAFFASAAVSAKDIQFNFGQPQTSINSHNELLISLPVSIVNRGFYNIGDFGITSVVRDAEGDEITRGSTLVPVIRRDEEITAHHNMTLSISDMLQRSENYLFNDSELRFYVAVGLSLAQLIPVEAQTNFTIPWGAPLYNFSLGTPQYSPHNATHFRVLIPVNFENHASFDLMGQLQVRMFNSGNLPVGDGETSIDTPQQSSHDGLLELYVAMSRITATGRFEANLFSPLFNYGPWVIPYG